MAIADHAPEQPALPPETLPRDLLCEVCGYGLFGLSSENTAAVCPECGTPIVESIPTHRVGPPWQNRLSFANWFATAWAIARRPGETYRTMRLDGPATPARLFLLSIALIVGIGWGAFSLLAIGYHPLGAWLAGMAAAKVVLVMTYIETLGVTFFSGRRGWRVPFRLAERVTCYASVGWVIAAAVLAPLVGLYDAGLLREGVIRIVGHWDPDYRWILTAVGFGAAVLFFETLVWTGVRKVRFGNRQTPPPIA
ncbi:MAG: hypothetical protein AAGH99_12415 [Planctomycetota bacterium]